MFHELFCSILHHSGLSCFDYSLLNTFLTQSCFPGTDWVVESFRKVAFCPITFFYKVLQDVTRNEETLKIWVFCFHLSLTYFFPLECSTFPCFSTESPCKRSTFKNHYVFVKKYPSFLVHLGCGSKALAQCC